MNIHKIMIEEKNSKSSLITIDIARAIAALGVFYYHQRVGDLLFKHTGIVQFKATDAFGAFYAVPLFFLISGYCIHLSNLKYVKNKQALPIKEYYKRRLLRIYPPYLVAVVFSILVNFFTHTSTPISWADLLVHIFLLQGFTVSYFNSINIVLWTITIELAFYIIYPLFYYLCVRFSLLHAICFSFIVSCISIAIISTLRNLPLPLFYFVLNLWFAWCCGAYLADKKTLNKTDLSQPGYKIFYAIIVAMFAWKFTGHWFSPIVGYQVNILIWTGPLLFLLNKESFFAKKQWLLLKVIAALGLSSYSLYLFHEPLIFLKNLLVHKYLPQQLQLAGLIGGFFFIPVITWLSYLYVERPFISKKRKRVTE